MTLAFRWLVTMIGTTLLVGSAGPSVLAADDVDEPDGGLTTGPTVEPETGELTVGDDLVLTLRGFEAATVTVVFCGNEGRRGSSDCDMVGARAVEIDDGSETLTRIIVTRPPEPCPCIVRVSGKAESEIAVTPIVILGHPSAPTVDPVARAATIEAQITVRRSANGGFARLRSALGGSTGYDLVISVRNVSTTPVEGVRLSASVGRTDSEDLGVAPDLERPPRLLPGQTWETVVGATLPAPAWGEAEWRVSATVDGTSTTTTTTTTLRPTALYGLSLVLLVNISFLTIRGLWRAQRAWRSRRMPVSVALGDESVA